MDITGFINLSSYSKLDYTIDNNRIATITLNMLEQPASGSLKDEDGIIIYEGNSGETDHSVTIDFASIESLAPDFVRIYCKCSFIGELVNLSANSGDIPFINISKPLSVISGDTITTLFILYGYLDTDRNVSISFTSVSDIIVSFETFFVIKDDYEAKQV